MTLQRACEKCAHNKRKCDRVVPRCGRCTKLDAVCIYDLALGSPSSSAVPPRQTEVQVALSHFAAFESGADQLKPLLMALDVDWRRAVEHYFQTVHNVGSLSLYMHTTLLWPPPSAKIPNPLESRPIALTPDVVVRDRAQG